MSQGFTSGIPIDTDQLLSANSDGLVSSQKAVKAYIDNIASNSRARKLFAYKNTDSTVTATISETILTPNDNTFLIPGGTMGANGILIADMFIYKIGTAGTCVYNMYLNTSPNTLVGAVLIGRITTTAATLTERFQRHLVNKNSEVANYIYNAGTNSTSEFTAGTAARQAVNINTTTDKYFILTATLANTGDTAGVGDIQLYIDKP